MTNMIWSYIKKHLYVYGCLLTIHSFAQNTGIGLTFPQAKLHIKGSENISQLLIDAHSIQSNSQPLIRLRKATGFKLMDIHSDDSTNVFIGLHAGKVNIASGVNGIQNTFFGSLSGFSNTSGRYNSAFGSNALYSNTSGSSNIAIGNNAMRSNTTGSKNTSSGVNSMSLNTTGNKNIAIGDSALYYNTTGSNNIAIGSKALQRNVGNSRISAIGFEAMRYADNNVTGQEKFNTAIGFRALQGLPTSTNTGKRNTAAGDHALHTNNNGNNNTAFGVSALHFSNDNDSSNVAIGFEALQYSANSSTVGVGDGAGTFAENSITCTYVGNDADNDSFTPTYSNSTALGNGSRITASNQVRIGNASVTSIGGFVGWTDVSDGRFKKDILENVPGLEFILKLRPVTYYLDVHALASRLNEDQANSKDPEGNAPPSFLTFEARNAKAAILKTGFIAQEVEAAANDIGFNFSGIDSPGNETGLYGLRYSQFVVPLVKAAQEQQERIDYQQQRINEHQSKIKEIQASIKMLKNQ